MENRVLLRVEDLSSACGLTVRQLQRLFRKQVGWSPKWVIQRYRLHEILEQVSSGRSIDWLGLAERMGYFYRAHFICDFKQLIGETPAEYTRKVKWETSENKEDSAVGRVLLRQTHETHV
jgi:AraC-like DNA-binding protein